MPRARRCGAIAWVMAAATMSCMLPLAGAFDDNLQCTDVGKATEYNLSPCDFAMQYCLDDVYSSTYHCASATEKGFLIVACVLWLGLLFVLLGSTADDFFSPALEQFSTKLGLPPRFAGVTLLALGNGAPDVSSTIASINQGEKGYLLSLGALTGAGMFVGTVVAGSVMVAAGGVKARGALIRDVCMYLGTCALVLTIFSSGEVTLGDVATLLFCYFSFISVVLAADIYHRAVVLPREKGLLLAAAGAGGPSTSPSTEGVMGFEMTDSGQMASAISALQEMQMEMATDQPQFPVSGGGAHAPVRVQRDIEGVTNHRAQYIIMHADDYDYELDRAHDFARIGGERSNGSPRLLSPLGGDANYRSLDDGAGGPLPTSGRRDGGHHAHGSSQDKELSLWGRAKDDFDEGYSEFMAMPPLGRVLYVAEWPFALARKCSVPITADDNYCKPWLLVSIALMPLWLVGFYLGLARETIGGTPPDQSDDVYDDASLAGGDGGAPRSHEGDQRHHTPVQTGDGGFPVLVLSLMISSLVSVGVHFTCTDRKPPPTVIAAPLALVGFACAATWIDTIANNLVSVLGFFGWLLGIPQPVLGLTVLAWGNSIGDYSTNMAMARKGLSNMAMTACFAGPVFNMLVGTGIGFSVLLNSKDEAGVSDRKTFNVQLSPGIIAGFCFLMLNCTCVALFGIFNGNQVPKEYGYVSAAMYGVYLIVSFLLLFDAFGFGT